MKASIALSQIKTSPCAMGGWTCDKYLMVGGQKAQLKWADAERIVKEFPQLGGKVVPGLGAAISYEDARAIAESMVQQ